MKLVWPKPNWRGFIIFVSFILVLSDLCLFLLLETMYHTGRMYHAIWPLMFTAILVFYPLSMYTGRIVKSQPGSSLPAVAARFVFFAPAIVVLVHIVLWEGEAYLSVAQFYWMFAIIISIPMIVMLMVSLYRSHPIVFWMVATLLVGLLLVGLLEIYIAHPAWLLFFLITPLISSLPVLSLVNVPSKRITVILYLLFMCGLVLVYKVPWSPRHSFERALSRISPGRYLNRRYPGMTLVTRRHGPGMSFAEVDKIMQEYWMRIDGNSYPPLVRRSEDTVPDTKQDSVSINARRQVDVSNGFVYYSWAKMRDKDGGVAFRDGHVVRVWMLDTD